MLEMVNDRQIDSPTFMHFIMLFFAAVKESRDVLHLLVESNVNKPLSEPTRLLDTLLSLLHANLLAIFENVPLD